MSPSVILSPSSPYAQLYPYNMVKDTVAHTWTFSAVVKNLLAQPIGTVDGTTVVGTKVAITEGPTVTGGTGTVTVANADGTGTFTGPDQPYFFYHELTAPQAFTAEKPWRFNVPNTVTAISISVVISTDFPSQLSVTLTPPDSAPAWFADDSMRLGRNHAGDVKGVLSLCFKEGTSLEDRQLAVAYANGVIVGGSPVDGGDGCYYLKVPDDGSADPRVGASSRLNSLPQEEVAVPVGLGEPRGSTRAPDCGGRGCDTRSDAGIGGPPVDSAAAHGATPEVVKLADWARLRWGSPPHSGHPDA